MPTLVEKTKQVLLGVDTVAAAYLFGSAADPTGPVVNDLDLLVLPVPESDPFEVITQVSVVVSDALKLSVEQIDVLLFDLRLANPEIAYKAIVKGLQLKNSMPGLLAARIESLSRYFMANEYLIKEGTRLQREMVIDYASR